MRPKLNKEQFLAKMAEGREARKYAQKIIKEHGEKTNEFTTQGLWQESIANDLKEKTLTFFGSTLKYLSQDKMVNFADWLLDRLEDFVLERYNQSDEITKGAFKKKVEEVLPDHRIIGKLN
ncbi:hypothetical protein [endosymbiont GvMRE of Glomus versiforme]|uniref:hypothetical protein n=1 Tax=endosymbiont GvMRE of Glomus versiforme TaxID=2039283 RepID=UPI000EDDC2C2|nr:hypothetical protein [endosymbiont GvMRE of Glomus versiforme]RHZ37146.1 hypothetical protein GvMRE_I1g497 [endosymbiont GvMRE of Glomus versiforme]